MRIFVSITACNANKKKTAYGKKKTGKNRKIPITESVKIGNHSTVFLVGESPNLKPTCKALNPVEMNQYWEK